MEEEKIIIDYEMIIALRLRVEVCKLSDIYSTVTATI